jgi:excinuclease ABC subunit A
MMNEQIILEKVATNNLKHIDVRFPIGQFSVVTGVSGSGKSSLVFDTLYGEAYRRYVESLSSFARQYLKMLPKPVVERVLNLPPAIAVKQSRSSATSRSTVGTMTEVYDLLRIIFAHNSEIICPNCKEKVNKDSGESIAKKSLEQFGGKQVLVCASLKAWQKSPAKELKLLLTSQGFSRLLVDGKMARLEDATATSLKDADVIIDRIQVNEENFRRVAQSAELALRVGRNRAALVEEKSSTRAEFTSDLACAICASRFLEPTLALFSFNHPYGACTTCQGFGQEGVVDFTKCVPDLFSNLENEGVAMWNFGERSRFYQLARTSAKILRIDVKKVFGEYDEGELKWLMYGDGKKFPGIAGIYAWFESKRHKAHYRIHVARFRKYVSCSGCNGRRLNEKSLACRIEGLNIAEVCEKNISEFSNWLTKFSGHDDVASWSLQQEHTSGVKEAIDECQARVKYLLKIGLGYLTFSRLTRSLSGGEQQRINMARCLGSALTDTLYCLDEPSCGLHARDSKNLLEIIYELRDQGNTVVVVEHERTLIKNADYFVEIGPDAGHQGGQLMFAGLPRDYKPSRKVHEYSRAHVDAAAAGEKNFTLRGATTNNLRNVDVTFPVGKLTAVCGVSGSGKTSLIQHTLYPLLAKMLGQTTDDLSVEPKAKAVEPKAAVMQHSEVVLVSQGQLGRSSRSTIATYLGVMEEVRKIFADQPLAKKYGLKPTTFSFNTAGGRCETCKGLGTVVEDLSFLGEMAIICPSCNGKRFDEKVLEVEYLGKNLTDVLGMTVAETRELFFAHRALVKVLDSVIDMGLGYITLGQHTSSFSGGEAQRLKLLRLMKTAKHGEKPKILIFDEPTTGLSDKDVVNLIEQFFLLCRLKHTVIVVEHHLDVMKAADWLVEIGPEAADRGGELVYQGVPAGISGVARSITAPYLKD